jgi:endonuclease/exonuclease/phosphatase family metal-dependent hydrolase
LIQKFNASCLRTGAAMALSIVSIALVSASAGGPTKGRPLKVMTRNLYQGTNFDEALAARTGQEFVAAVATTIHSVRASQPAVRAAAVAREIAEDQPALVGVQEVATWSTGPSPTTLTVEIDQLALLLNQLQLLGQHYAVTASVTYLDFTVPSQTEWVRVRVAEVMLARTDLDPAEMIVSNPQGDLFIARFAIEHPVLGTVSVPRAWVSVDVTLKDRMVRFVSTHLDNILPSLHLAQAQELLTGPANTTLPVVLLGDFNTRADDPSDVSYPTYAALTAGNLAEVWPQVNPDTAGFTCCHDVSLTNPADALNGRIDLVFVRGPIEARRAWRVGERPEDMLGGFWPSDHAGVVATLWVQ